MNSEFSINAYTAALKKHGAANQISIIDNGCWEIPVYQRPYSWNEDNIDRLMFDLLENYTGENGRQQPMFIGTMQFSEDKGGCRQVIDGQQRLTTFLLLLDLLNDEMVEDEVIQTNWLKTKVNNGTAQKDLDEAIAANREKLETLAANFNPYAQNRLHINSYLESYTNKEGDSKLDLRAFRTYILTQVYFVCIETQASLAKTLQIFETINATGMDLNGGDLFKVHFYEYLTTKKGQPVSIFNEISQLYTTIEKANKEHQEFVTSIDDILNIYKYILISKYKLSNTLYFLGVGTFYENLFQKLINNESSDGFKKELPEEFELKIEELEKIIELRVTWHRSLGKTAEEDLAYYFIMWSRYSRYWQVLMVYKFAYQEQESNFSEFIIQFSKLLWIYSVSYGRAVNECHRIVREMMKIMFSGKQSHQIIDFINQKINAFQESPAYINRLVHRLNTPITGNYKHKNLICRLQAMLIESYNSKEVTIIRKLKNDLFIEKIDIEHIASYHHLDKSKRELYWKEWGPEINCIGNLMVLERDFNQSISNKLFNGKKDKYSKSRYKEAVELSHPAQKWGVEHASKRKKQVIKRILDYLFEE